MPSMNTKEDMKSTYELFQRFALDDQRSYYKRTVERYRKAAAQVNWIRASFAFTSGVASALVGLVVGILLANGSFTAGGECVLEADICSRTWFFISGLTLVAVIAPVVGAAFTTLADLYQWDRMVTIYTSAVENLEEADALSPLAEMDDDIYRLSLRVYAESSLRVMRDETAQWGQSIRTPPQLEKYIEAERQKAAAVKGSADDLVDRGPTTPEMPPV